jgi:predicted pyridoxine 5'-phosphate oxidase superfamily flavin-nucleotide-binding protein
MSSSYRPVAFTPEVREAQERYGSGRAMSRGTEDAVTEPEPGQGDPLTDDERGFVASLDGFYLATVSATGWPYVQFRGGPKGFVRTPDEHTIAWADFRGNRQYISTGNLAADERVAMIFLDQARQVRLKVYGRAYVVDVGDGEVDAALAVPGYRATVEREVRVDVTAYDWNCPQHITPRYSAEELAPALQPLRDEVAALRKENARLRAQAGVEPPATS